MRNRKLSHGDEAPNIAGRDHRGQMTSIKQAKQPYVLVAFLRYAGCPFCNLALHRLTMEHTLLRNSRCDIIAVLQSSVTSIDKNVMKRHKEKPQFPIMPDEALIHHKNYHVRPSIKTTTRMIKDLPHWVHAVKDHGWKQGNIDGNLFIAPALFLVDKTTMKILHVDYGADLFSHDTFSPIYDQLQFAKVT